MKKILFFLVCYQCLISQSLGQRDNYFNYSLEDGLPQSQVFCIAQDNRGYLWLGTQGGGLARYDGNTFITYSTQNGLSSDFVNTLHQPNNTELYIGTSRGLNSLVKSKIITHTLNKDRSTNVTSLCSSDQELYVGTNDGVIIFDMLAKRQVKRAVFDQLKNHYINDVKSIHDELWIGTNRGLWIYNKKGKSLSKSNKAPQPNVAHIYFDGTDGVWLAIMDYGIIFMQAQTKSILTKITNEEIKKTLSLDVDKNQNLWIATQHDGLYKYQIASAELSSIRAKDLTATKLRVLCRDRWDNLWIGTSGEGLIKKASQLFKHYYLTDYGYKSNKVYALTSGKNNKILCATADQKILQFDGNDWTLVYADSSKTKIKTIAMDSSGTLWMGTEGKGILKKHPNEWVETLSYSHGNFKDDIIVQMVNTKENAIWAATNSSGIAYLNGDLSQHYDKAHGLLDDYISAIALDSKENLWYTTKKGGLGYIKNKQIKNIPTTLTKQGQAIKSIAIDAYDNIYMSIIGDGLYQYQPKTNKLEKLVLKDKSFSSSIYSMAFSSDGKLWLGVENGSYALVFDKNYNLVDVQFYTKGDGFLGIENCHNALLKDIEGNLWFGTMNGISVFDNDNKVQTTKNPILHVSDVLLYYKPILETSFGQKFSQDHILPHNQNHISFQFKALHLNHADKIKYRFKLEGADTRWSSWENKEEVNYAKLESGTYAFKVQASIDGKQMSDEVSIPFSIATPFWQQWWFRLMMTSMLIGSIVYFFKQREKNIKEKELQKNQQLEIENQLLGLEQKALQLQMNPHFIFNALNSIQSVIVDQDVDKARSEIQNFAILMRSILNNSRKKTTSIDEELQTIKKYLELEQFCQKNTFEYTIEIDPMLDTEETQIPSMLLQPFIENAVIHGISHLKTKGYITVKFEKEGDVLLCTITDNGVGRTKAKELTLGTKGHVSLGMEVTENRLNNYAKDTISTPQQIIDLYDQNGNAVGTQVILKIPITLPY